MDFVSKTKWKITQSHSDLLKEKCKGNNLYLSANWKWAKKNCFANEIRIFWLNHVIKRQNEKERNWITSIKCKSAHNRLPYECEDMFESPVCCEYRMCSQQSLFVCSLVWHGLTALAKHSRSIWDNAPKCHPKHRWKNSFRFFYEINDL